MAKQLLNARVSLSCAVLSSLLAACSDADPTCTSSPGLCVAGNGGFGAAVAGPQTSSGTAGTASALSGGVAGLAGSGGRTVSIATNAGTAGNFDVAGAAGSPFIGGAAGASNTAGSGGLGGSLGGAAGASNTAGSGGLGGSLGVAGASEDPFGRRLDSGTATVATTPRPSYGAVRAVNSYPSNESERSYVVESRRDIESGPLGLPFRSRFRLAAYDLGVLVWAYQADLDDQIADVVVHPSGELTVAIQRYVPETLSYQLLRLNRDGQPLGTTTLNSPVTLPDTDLAASDPRPLFRMKAALADATTAGWMAMVADGEAVALAVLSLVNARANDAWSNRLALGVETLDWTSSEYVERWARVVEGTHFAEPAAWAYDELRWREQAVRPFLTRDTISGDWIVGRVWNTSRCTANRLVFAEFTRTECMLTAVGAGENERLPLAVTRFSSTGARLSTRVLAPDESAAEQVPFALAVHPGGYVVAGSLVQTLADGSKRTYPDPSGYVDYDGYVYLYGNDGYVVARQTFNLGRGDVLAGLRATPQGFVAVGSSGWDRWQGGMSISRGSDPLMVWVSMDLQSAKSRTFNLTDGSRHFNLHDIVLTERAIVGYGFSDAPMTHSADGNTSARTFGGLQVRLEEP